jgi:hypothetical protein
MKITIFAIVLLVSIILFCGFSVVYTENTITEILDTLDMCEDEVNNGDWELALDHIYLTNSLWYKHKTVLETFLRHEEIDNVTQALCRTTATVTEKNRSEFMIESVCLAESIEHISTLDYSTAANIF